MQDVEMKPAAAAGGDAATNAPQDPRPQAAANISVSASSTAATTTAARGVQQQQQFAEPSRAQKLQGMNRDVLEMLTTGDKTQDDAMTSAALPPSMPSLSLPVFPPSNNKKTTSEAASAEGGPGGDTTNSGATTKTSTNKTSIKIGNNRWINVKKPARQWTWAPFSSSSRVDGTLFYHWVRAHVEYPDYPYARFDIHLDPVTYTSDEYNRYIAPVSNSSSYTNDSDGSQPWTRTETDHLLDLVRRFEMRWPVIYDRWTELYSSSSTSSTSASSPDPSSSSSSSKTATTKDDNNTDNTEQPPPTKKAKTTAPFAPAAQRKIEDLQYRFYQVAAILNGVRISREAAAEARQLADTSVSSAAADAAGAEQDHDHHDHDDHDHDHHIKPSPEALLVEMAAARSLAATADPQQQPLITNIGTGTSNKVFNLEYERERRAWMEAMWNRTKDEEQEEAELRKELKQIDAQLRKIKKSGGHSLVAAKVTTSNSATAGSKATGAAAAGGGTSSLLSSAPSSRNPSRSTTPMPDSSATDKKRATGSAAAAAAQQIPTLTPAALDSCFMIVTPMPGTPYLQSGRLAPPLTSDDSHHHHDPSAAPPSPVQQPQHQRLNQTILTRMDTLLQQLKVPLAERPSPLPLQPPIQGPLPTKRCCDLYDSVRKDALTLLILQKNVLQKEGLVQSKRLKADKLSAAAAASTGASTTVMTEEFLMGIAPPPPPAPAPAPKAPPLTAATSTTAASTTGVAARKPSKAAAAMATAAAATATKSKSITKKQAAAAAAAAAASVGATTTGKTTAATAPGGKQARKPSVKRKRKTDGKSPVPPGATIAGQGAGAAATAKTSGKSKAMKTKASASGAVGAGVKAAPSKTALTGKAAAMAARAAALAARSAKPAPTTATSTTKAPKTAPSIARAGVKAAPSASVAGAAAASTKAAVPATTKVAPSAVTAKSAATTKPAPSTEAPGKKRGRKSG